MVRNLLLAVAGVAVLSTGAVAASTPAYVTAAVADSSRPADDTKRDADRKPAEMMVFAGVKPGQKVADLVPGGGYFTRIIAKIVGPNGHVYALTPTEWGPEEVDPAKAIAADAYYGNVTALNAPLGVFAAPPEKLDIFWTSQNYHDLENPQPKVDVAAFNKEVFDALRPGGLYI